MTKDLAEKEKVARRILSEIAKYDIKKVASLTGSERQAFLALLFEYNQLDADESLRPLLKRLEKEFSISADIKETVGKTLKVKMDKSERNWMYYLRDEMSARSLTREAEKQSHERQVLTEDVLKERVKTAPAQTPTEDKPKRKLKKRVVKKTGKLVVKKTDKKLVRKEIFADKKEPRLVRKTSSNSERKSLDSATGVAVASGTVVGASKTKIVTKTLSTKDASVTVKPHSDKPDLKVKKRGVSDVEVAPKALEVKSVAKGSEVKAPIKVSQGKSVPQVKPMEPKIPRQPLNLDMPNTGMHLEFKNPSSLMPQEIASPMTLPDGTKVAPQVIEARKTGSGIISVDKSKLSPQDYDELLRRVKANGLQVHELSDIDFKTGKPVKTTLTFENTPQTRVFLESNLNPTGTGIETPQRAAAKLKSRVEAKPPISNLGELPDTEVKRYRLVDGELRDVPDTQKNKALMKKAQDFGAMLDKSVGPTASKTGSVLKSVQRVGGKTIATVTAPIGKAFQAVNTAKTAATVKIASVKGGKAALKAASATSKAVSKAGAPLLLLTMALDPKGSREFMDDIAHLRGKKIATEMWDGVVQMASDPKGTAKAMWAMGEEAVKKRFEGDETFGDYALSSGEAAWDGLMNIGDTIWGTTASLADVSADGSNWVRQRLGMDLIEKDTITYEAYKRDPLKFVGNLFIPTTVDTKTGLRSDDTLMTLIEKDNSAALRAYIQQNKEDVNRNIRGVYDGGDTPYDTALQHAIANGNMKVAYVLYEQENVNLRGTNAVTGDTLLMTLLYKTAPQEDEEAYKTGIVDIDKYHPRYKEKMQISQAIMDDLLSYRGLDEIGIHATNKEGKDAFIVAAECGNLSVVGKLLKLGANVNKTTAVGRNALYYCSHNQLMTKSLIEAGINCNQVDDFGETPLMHALKYSAENMNSIALLMLASDENGVKKLRESKLCMKKLDALFKDNPQAKSVVLMMEGHPFQALFKERYPKDAARLAEELKLNKADTSLSATTESSLPESQEDKNGFVEPQSLSSKNQGAVVTLTGAAAVLSDGETTESTGFNEQERGDNSEEPLPSLAEFSSEADINEQGSDVVKENPLKTAGLPVAQNDNVVSVENIDTFSRR